MKRFMRSIILKPVRNGFLSKSTRPLIQKSETLYNHLRALQAICKQNGAAYVLASGPQDAQKKQSNPLGTLSQRELEVMDLMLEGKWTKDIAMILGISGSSVSTYKTRIFEKLGYCRRHYRALSESKNAQERPTRILSPRTLPRPQSHDQFFPYAARATAFSSLLL